MLVVADTLTIGVILNLEHQGYKIEMHADEEYAKITKDNHE